MQTANTRFNGKLVKWNADRGFGFVVAEHGDQELFVHVSAFPRNGRLPVLGEPLSFEMELDKEGRKRAVRVRRLGDQLPANEQHQLQRPVRRSSRRAPERTGARVFLLAFVLLLVAAGVGWLGYTRYIQRIEAARAAPQYNAPSLLCDGRKHCSQMSSCGEAKLFLKTCPGMEMDGDHDGIPCEESLCSGLLGR